MYGLEKHMKSHRMTPPNTNNAKLEDAHKKTPETKQKQQYMGEYKRPDVAGRKFEPTFIFKK